MTREHESRNAARGAQIPHADGERAIPATELAKDGDEAFKAVDTYVKTGKGNAADMPLLLKAINRDRRTEVWSLMPELAKRVGPARFFACAAAFDYEPYFAIDVALENGATDAQIRTYLRRLSVDELAQLDRHIGVLAKLRTILPGPLALELPELANLPVAIHDKPHLIRWFVESTQNKTVLAIALAQEATSKLAATLDAEGLWGWVDDLAAIGGGATLGPGLEQLAKATKQDAVKAKLEQILGTFPREQEDDSHQDARAERQRDGLASLNAHIAGDVDTAKLLDMAARAGGIASKPEKEMLAKLEGEHADVVLQVAIASKIDSKKILPILLDAPGVTAEHVFQVITATLYTDHRLAVFLDDRLRPRIRKLLGRSFRFLGFFPVDGGQADTVHAKIVDEEALRVWVYEDKDPVSLLWLAMGSQEGAKKGLRHVQSEKGVAWVFQLPVDAPSEQLRRLILFTDNRKVKQHVEEKLLADKPIEYEAGDWDAKPGDATTRGAGDRARFDVALHVAGATQEELLARIDDLEPDERAAVTRDASTLAGTLGKLSSDNLLRALHLLQPTLPQLLQAGVQYEDRALSYVRSRPASEAAIVLGDRKLSKAASTLITTSPFVVFPSLLDPKVTAKALDTNPSLMDWMFDHADASLVLSVLAREPARTQAALIVESNLDVYAKLPRYKFLLPEGKAGFDQLATALEDDEPREDASKYKAGKKKLDKEEKRDGKALHDAAQQPNLWSALEQLGRSGDEDNALAIVRTFPKDQLELLSGRHPEAVENLRAMVPLTPQHVFPALGIAQLLACPESARWLFEYEAAFVVLDLVAGKAPAIKQLARLVEAGGEAVVQWQASLPRGASLDARERVVLDELCKHLTNPDKIRRLFEVRFDSKIEDDFDAAGTKRLWGVLARLPPAQVSLNVIEQYKRDPIGSADGLWDDPELVLSDDDSKFEARDKDTTYDAAQELTRDEVKRYFGLDDAALAIATGKDGWIEQVGAKFKVKPITQDNFKATVLHEVGHSVDTLLGERTELVFKLADWRNYGIDQVEQWAEDMKALDGVKGADREKIVEAWRHALRAGQSVPTLVPDTHPAVASKYAHVPLVKAARDHSLFGHSERREVNGRVGLTGNNQGTIASVPKATVDVAPSDYSLSAPAEFFAECYTEFYRQYDGTPKTEALKGGKLATWIKDWFKAHVDTIELSPHRMKKTKSEPAPKQDGQAGR